VFNRSILVLGLMSLLTTINVSAQCFGVVVTQQTVCNCGEMVSQQVCQGTQGQDCDPLGGPVRSCGSHCQVINAAGCLSANSHAFPDNYRLKAPALWSMNSAVSSCGAAGQLTFEEWLRVKLSQKTL
jgi:hypothetical protein